MKSVEEIVSLYLELRKQQAPVVAQMAEIRDIYNGDIVLPLPELNRSERAAVANLLSLGIDQNARRIASTQPNIEFPVAREGVSSSERQSQRKRKAMFGMWEANNIASKQRRRARWFVGYSSAPVVLRPDFGRRTASWQLRDPLTTLAPLSLDPDEMCPPYAIFTMTRSAAWLQRAYPDMYLALRDEKSPALAYEILEYVDDKEFVLIALGTKADMSPWNTEQNPMQRARQLERIENRTEMCPVSIPKRIVLDRSQGQFDGIIGMYYGQAKLMALELIAVERGIFKEKWFVHRPNEMGSQIITVANPREGIMGEVKGGEIEQIAPDPSLVNLQAIDRMERNQRVTAGIPAEFGGESTTNVRTGRRGDAVLSAVVDFPVQEAQEIFAAALQYENKVAIAIDKAYFGEQPKSFYCSWPGARGKVDYTPNKLWTSDENYVTFSHAGADVNGLVIAGGERIGMGTMSKKTFMKIDPLVDDADLEHDRVVAEGLEMAMMQAIQQQAAQGAIPPHFVARIASLVLGGTDLADAIDQVQQEAQQAQSAQVQPGAAEAQPGIAQPGAGAEASVAGPTSGSQNLAALLQSLRAPQRTVASEQSGGGPAQPRQLARTPGGQ